MLLQLDVIRVWLGQNMRKKQSVEREREREREIELMWTVLTVGQCHPPNEIISSQNCNQSCRNTSATILTQRLLGGNFLSLWFLPTHPFFYSVVQNALSISSTFTFNHTFEGCWTEGVFHFGNNKCPSKPLSTKNNSVHQKCSSRSIESEVFRPLNPYCDYRKAVHL